MSMYSGYSPEPVWQRDGYGGGYATQSNYQMYNYENNPATGYQTMPSSPYGSVRSGYNHNYNYRSSVPSSPYGQMVPSSPYGGQILDSARSSESAFNRVYQEQYNHYQRATSPSHLPHPGYDSYARQQQPYGFQQRGSQQQTAATMRAGYASYQMGHNSYGATSYAPAYSNAPSSPMYSNRPRTSAASEVSHPAYQPGVPTPRQAPGIAAEARGIPPVNRAFGTSLSTKEYMPHRQSSVRASSAAAPARRGASEERSTFESTPRPGHVISTDSYEYQKYQEMIRAKQGQMQVSKPREHRGSSAPAARRCTEANAAIMNQMIRDPDRLNPHGPLSDMGDNDRHSIVSKTSMRSLQPGRTAAQRRAYGKRVQPRPPVAYVTRQPPPQAASHHARTGSLASQASMGSTMGGYVGGGISQVGGGQQALLNSMDGGGPPSVIESTATGLRDPVPVQQSPFLSPTPSNVHVSAPTSVASLADAYPSTSQSVSGQLAPSPSASELAATPSGHGAQEELLQLYTLLRHVLLLVGQRDEETEIIEKQLYGALVNARNGAIKSLGCTPPMFGSKRKAQRVRDLEARLEQVEEEVAQSKARREELSRKIADILPILPIALSTSLSSSAPAAGAKGYVDVGHMQDVMRKVGLAAPATSLAHCGIPVGIAANSGISLAKTLAENSGSENSGIEHDDSGDEKVANRADSPEARSPLAPASHASPPTTLTPQPVTFTTDAQVGQLEVAEDRAMGQSSSTDFSLNNIATDEGLERIVEEPLTPVTSTVASPVTFAT